MRIDQFVPSFVMHDAISNHATEARRVLRSAGYESDIYSWQMDPRRSREARDYRECSAAPDPERILLYHSSTDSPMAAWLEDVAKRGQRLSIDYHNITPSAYFARWEPPAAKSMRVARHELLRLAPATELAMADSAYNEAELVEAGYARTAVCPLLVDLEDYHREPDARMLGRLQRDGADGGHRWLFVGRIAPNKCQHDVIAAFAVYRRLADPRARLSLVGGATSPRYLRALHQMAEELELGDSLEVREALSFTQLLAYFRAADVFVCLSEHEGFCVPIIEAMELGVPVVAYAAAAVTDTVSSAGVLLADKDPLAVACAVDEVMSDAGRRGEIVAAGRARAAEHALERTSRQFLDTVEGCLGRPEATVGAAKPLGS